MNATLSLRAAQGGRGPGDHVLTPREVQQRRVIANAQAAGGGHRLVVISARASCKDQAG